MEDNYNKNFTNYNNLINVIKEEIKSQIEEEFDEYKQNCLKNLEYEIEKKRNSVVSSILNGISLQFSNTDMYRNEPVINIQIKKNVYLKEDR